MSKTKHTPTPWTYDSEGNIYCEKKHGKQLVGTFAGKGELAVLIADTSTTKPEFGDEAQANAEFIVRACNSNAQLVEALEKYGGHLIDCELITTPCFDGDKRDLFCTCGYETTLAAAKGETDG